MLNQQDFPEAEETARETESTFEKYPHWRVSASQERDVRKELWGILIKAKAKAQEGTRVIKDIDINELKEIIDQLLRVAGRAGE